MFMSRFFESFILHFVVCELFLCFLFIFVVFVIFFRFIIYYFLIFYLYLDFYSQSMSISGIKVMIYLISVSFLIYIIFMDRFSVSGRYQSLFSLYSLTNLFYTCTTFVGLIFLSSLVVGSAFCFQVYSQFLLFSDLIFLIILHVFFS